LGNKTNQFSRIVDIACNLNLHRKAGLSPEDMAVQYGVSSRTIRRDINTLQDLGVQVELEGGRFFLVGSFLPPVTIFPSEATVILMGLRLLASNANAYYDRISSTFTKLNCVAPPPLQEEIRKTLEWLRKREANPALAMVMDTLAIGWVERRRVRIKYQSQEHTSPAWITVEPYFIQPVAALHATYLIAWNVKADSMRTYKVERIEAAELTDEQYEVPDSFRIDQHLENAIGIVPGDKVETVRLRFSKNMARTALETRWHHSQTSARQRDGSVIVTMKLAKDSWELVRFVLGYGAEVEVLEPVTIKQKVTAVAREIALP